MERKEIFATAVILELPLDFKNNVKFTAIQYTYGSFLGLILVCKDFSPHLPHVYLYATPDKKWKGKRSLQRQLF